MAPIQCLEHVSWIGFQVCMGVVGIMVNKHHMMVGLVDFILIRMDDYHMEK
jgi:hypothetical protein